VFHFTLYVPTSITQLPARNTQALASLVLKFGFTAERPTNVNAFAHKVPQGT